MLVDRAEPGASEAPWGNSRRLAIPWGSRTLPPLTLLARTLAGLPPTPGRDLRRQLPYHDVMLGTCPNGHQLRTGRVLVGWSPCNCAAAWAANKGHRTTQCRDCEDEGWTTVRYEPHHVHGAGHPGR